MTEEITVLTEAGGEPCLAGSPLGTGPVEDLCPGTDFLTALGVAQQPAVERRVVVIGEHYARNASPARMPHRRWAVKR